MSLLKTIITTITTVPLIACMMDKNHYSLSSTPEYRQWKMEQIHIDGLVDDYGINPRRLQIGPIPTPGSTPPPSIPPTPAASSLNYDYSNPYVLVDFNDFISWDTANQYCQSQVGSQYGLAYVDAADSMTQADQIQKMSELCNQTIMTSCYIGLRWNNITRLFEWNNDDPLDESNWAGAAPTAGTFVSGSQSFCVAVVEAFEYKWDNVLCNNYDPTLNLKAALCQNPQYGVTPSPTESPTTNAPTTRAPTTRVPTTKAPTTNAPTTKAPTTASDGLIDRYRGTSVWNDIKKGDRVLIKSFFGGYLRDDGDGTVSTNPIYSSPYFVWQVVDDDIIFSSGYSLRNLQTGKYLKRDGSYCKAGTLSSFSRSPGSWSLGTTLYLAVGRKYMSFKNKDNNLCCQVTSYYDTSINTGSCSSSAAGFTFEKLEDKSSTTMISNSNNRYEGTSIWDDIHEGDKVLIKSFRGVYLRDDGDGTISTDPRFIDSKMIWEVRDDFINNHIQFRNTITGKYLKNNNNNCWAGAITGSGDAGSWRLYSVSVSGQTWSYRRRYVIMVNGKHNECCQVSTYHDSYISSGSCSTTNAYFTIEILDSASATSAVSVGYHISDETEAAIKSSTAVILNTTSGAVLPILICVILVILVIINIVCCICQIKKMYASKYKSYQKVVSVTDIDKISDDDLYKN